MKDLEKIRTLRKGPINTDETKRVLRWKKETISDVIGVQGNGASM